MKKLGKLSINPERVMKNEELVNLRGGYGDSCPIGEHKYWCWCEGEGAVGMWEGCYTDQYDAYQSVQHWCSSYQGSCSPVS